MSRQKLTTDRIRKFSLPDGKDQSFLWDSDVPMLACRVTKNMKCFIFQGIFLRKTIRMTIGKVNDWRIDDARSEARRLQTLIDTGIDPREEKAQKLAEANLRFIEKRKGKVLFHEAWNEYISELKTGISSKTKRPYSSRYIEDHLNLSNPGGDKKRRGEGVKVSGPLAFFLDLPLSNITAPKIADWLSIERQIRPTITAHAYRLLRAFIRWLNCQPKYRGIIKHDEIQDDNVRKVVPRSLSKDGDCLQKEQLEVWFKEIKKLNNPVQSTYLQALLLTGARREELASLRWQDVDFDWESLRIKDKIEGDRIIPLTPYVAHLLKKLTHSTFPDGTQNPWVFSSKTSASGKIVEPRIAHNRALKSGKLPHLSLHGLRRSFGTLTEWIEVPTGIVAQIMGHKPSALAEKHYRRRPLDLLRKWHVKIEAWILEQANIYDY